MPVVAELVFAVACWVSCHQISAFCRRIHRHSLSRSSKNLLTSVINLLDSSNYLLAWRVILNQIETCAFVGALGFSFTPRREFLLKEGCKVNHLDTGSQTPIFYSAIVRSWYWCDFSAIGACDLNNCSKRVSFTSLSGLNMFKLEGFMDLFTEVYFYTRCHKLKLLKDCSTLPTWVLWISPKDSATSVWVIRQMPWSKKLDRIYELEHPLATSISEFQNMAPPLCTSGVIFHGARFAFLREPSGASGSKRLELASCQSLSAYN